ncbi:MAG TPA: M1 family aminopeptidase, partial [Candidatus Thermoplasmatota archaeon]|nr:M1 family aminopeptidase [Candidatus Thermoplasmatota archaeon]
MSKSHRLPGDVRPERYAVHVKARVDRPDFEGEVRVALRVARAVATVEMHARDLQVDDVEATVGGRALRGRVAKVDRDAQTVTLAFPQPLPAGEATLRLAFRGQVGRGMKGLYLSTDGAESCLATQCEEADARAIFPCFDEPAFKARLQWTVTTDPAMVVLANGPLAKVERSEDGATTWTFQETPPMSTYLAALGIGRFASTPEARVGGVPMRVWAMEGKEGFGRFGLDLGARLLPWFGDYFGQPYPFGKYDQVAVPSFAFGAMENAGLVTFRLSLLLIDPARSTWDERKDVALVVAHEFAHMWFGNLVTMAWWDDLWLNEAFAEWMAHRATHALQPDLDVWVRFRQRAYGALSTDSLDSTHAIYHPVQTAAEAQEMFDAITYGKGSAVMRMLEAFLGEEAFREGLRTYMAEFRFRNARGSDLWTHLGRASGRDVAAIMSAWVTQKGHPVVHVAFGSGRLVLRQRRARSSPAPEAAPAAVAADDVWPVPMVVRYEDDAGVQTHPVLLEAPEASVELPVQGRLRWLWPNAGDVGFFRCALDDHLLGAALHGRLEPEEQVALLRDLWGQVKAGQAAPEAFLRAFERIASTLGPHARYDLVGHVVASLRTLEALLESAHDEVVAGVRPQRGSDALEGPQERFRRGLP